MEMNKYIYTTDANAKPKAHSQTKQDNTTSQKQYQMTISHMQGQYIFWQPSLVTCCWLHVTFTHPHPTAHWGVPSHLLDAKHIDTIHTENAATMGSVV